MKRKGRGYLVNAQRGSQGKKVPVTGAGRSPAEFQARRDEQRGWVINPRTGQREKLD